MKFNQWILAFVLMLSVTFMQSAQAGVWEWCTAPLRSVASYIWSYRPITKAYLAEYEADKKKEYKQDRDNDIAQAHAWQEETNAKISHLKEGYQASNDQADTILATTVGLKQSIAKNEEEVARQAADHQAHTDVITADIKKLELEIASIALARAVLQDGLTQIQQHTVEHTQAVDTMGKDIGQLNDKLIVYEQQAQVRDEKIRRIRDILRPSAANRDAFNLQEKPFTTRGTLGSAVRDKY